MATANDVRRCGVVHRFNSQETSSLVFALIPSPLCIFIVALVAPTYDKLAEELADEADVFVAKVDGPENQGLTSRFGVRGEERSSLD